MSGSVLEAHPLKGITADCDVVTAARFMTDRSIAALGVYSHDGHDLLGVMTERDITRLVASGKDPATAHVQDIMTSHLITAEEPVTAAEALAMMNAHHVRHLIVVRDGSDHIISIRDTEDGD